MAGLTVNEKISFASRHATELAAEKHFFDANAAHRPLGYSVNYRNPGHWDVYANQRPGRISAWLLANPGGQTSARDGDRERAFRVRGELGNVQVIDERWDPHRPHPRELLRFRTVTAAMLWISEELMQEPE